MQQMFSHIVKHLRKQNCQATDSDGSCRYRGDNKTKCAVGCLIHDTEYRPSLEGNPASFNSVLTAVKKSGWPILEPESIQLLQDMQTIHDRFPPYEWEKKFQRVANEHQLQLPRLET